MQANGCDLRIHRRHPNSLCFQLSTEPAPFMGGSSVKSKDSTLEADSQIFLEPGFQGRTFGPRRKALNAFDQFAEREAGDKKLFLPLKCQPGKNAWVWNLLHKLRNQACVQHGHGQNSEPERSALVSLSISRSLPRSGEFRKKSTSEPAEAKGAVMAGGGVSWASCLSPSTINNDSPRRTRSRAARTFFSRTGRAIELTEHTLLESDPQVNLPPGSHHHQHNRAQHEGGAHQAPAQHAGAEMLLRIGKPVANHPHKQHAQQPA